MTKKRTRMLSAQEESILINAYLDDNDIRARNKLIMSYMPLATRAAEAFARRGTMTLEDLVQEAALAVGQAIDGFDRSKGVRLSTLAAYYIKAALMRHAMDYAGPTRIGTNLPDKKVFMNLRRMVSEIQAQNGGMPITDADRQDIADRLKVKLDVVKRMEVRIFASDVTVAHTDNTGDDDDGRTVVRDNVIAVRGEQGDVEKSMDRTNVMDRIEAIVESCFEERDLEIVRARLAGEMNPEKYRALTDKYSITVERVRQIQRGALATICQALQSEGIMSLDDIAM